MLAADSGGRRKPQGDGDEVVAVARTIADELLTPLAAAVDQSSVVPPSHVQALARAGLYGLHGPAEHGGHAASPGTVRLVFETLAGACGVTFFTWVQHHAPVRLLINSPNTDLRHQLLPALCAGEVIGGIAFAHLRRDGPPPVAAVPVSGGWLVRGEAPWVTAWGLAGVLAVAARVEGDDQRVLFLAVDANRADGLVPSLPLPLVAMAASSTVRLGFDDVFVGESDLIIELSLDAWRAQDRVITAQPNPAAFGVAATAIRLLAQRDATVAGRLDGEWARVREESYALADSGQTDDLSLTRLVGLRAHSLDLALRAAQALVTATGGRAMELSHPAQRLLREAAFYAIQAQTPALRQASLARLAWAQPGSS